MESELFCEWKRHFISVVKLMTQENVLLNLDGHRSHILWVANIEIPHKYGVVMLPAAFPENASNIDPRYQVFQAIGYT
jgi:hypothetical protein